MANDNFKDLYIDMFLVSFYQLGVKNHVKEPAIAGAIWFALSVFLIVLPAEMFLLDLVDKLIKINFRKAIDFYKIINFCLIVVLGTWSYYRLLRIEKKYQSLLKSIVPDYSRAYWLIGISSICFITMFVYLAQ